MKVFIFIFLFINLYSKEIIGSIDKLDFPLLNLQNIETRIDTGATNSSLHCTNIERVDDKFVKSQLLGDAVLRAGDCNFKQNKYDEALKFYDDAIKSKYNGYVYALYQKAIIEGLKGNVEDNIILGILLMPTSFLKNETVRFFTSFSSIEKVDFDEV